MTDNILFFHAPEFFPPLDFFFGVLNSDVWIVLDHVTFTTRSRQSRCRIKSDTGVTLLPIGVRRPCSKPIQNMVIDNKQPWQKYFLRNIRQFYSDTPFFYEYYPDVEDLVKRPNVLLETLTLDSCLWAAELMGKHVKYVRTSELRRPRGQLYKKLPVSQMIPMLLDKMGGQIFNKTFTHPYYPQRTDAFEPDLSILDVLFNIGAENAKTLIVLDEEKSFTDKIRKRLLKSPSQNE